MNLFKRKKSTENLGSESSFATVVLNAIHDGVVMTDKNGVIEFMNPAAATMTGYGVNNAKGLDYGLVIKLESKEGRELSENENPLIQAMKTNQPLEAFRGSLIVEKSDKRIPIAISVLPVEGLSQSRIITFRDIARELEEEGEQTEFISTASHEMRTPVATIDGYLSLAINPKTATIDERARGYLTAAQAASRHLGKLFQDLLDVTKLDDGHIRPRFEPVEMVSLIESISNNFIERAKENKIDYRFGSNEPLSFNGNRRVDQVVYSFVDVNFMNEIMNNLIDNALKYTPEGGSIYINVRGDGDRVLINVTDTGIGISSDDLAHIFQKFYRADNSDTRTIGGTGLGLYLVKQRVEAMGGKVWAESAFGEGSTFYVSLPRLTSDEYEKRMIVVRNNQMQEQLMRAAQVGQSPAVQQPQPTTIQQPQPIPQQPAPVQQPAQTSQPPAPPGSIPTQSVQSMQQPMQPPAQQPQQPMQPASQDIVNNQINNNLNGEVK